MQIENLEISRRPSYDSDFPNQLVGMVTLKGALGTNTVKLSNEALSRIFAVISAEVVETSRAASAQVKRAMSDAQSEPLLALTSKVEILE